MTYTPRSAEPWVFDHAYTNAVLTWTKHIQKSHSVRKSALYRGQIDKCLVCWAFKRRIHA